MNLTDLGYSIFNRIDVAPIDLQVPDSRSYFPDLGIEGEKLENLSVSKLTAGSIRVGEYIQSTGFVSGTSGWRISGDGSIEAKDLTLTGGTIKYGKTSFTDSTNAGYWIGSSGLYFGTASDTKYLKYNIGTGAFSLVGGSIDGTSTINSTLASWVEIGATSDLPPDTNLVGYWSFDEGTGATACDSSTNAKNGTINGNPTWVIGVAGQALDFDGAGDYVTADTTLANSTYSVVGWIKRDDPTAIEYLIDFRTGVGVGYVYFAGLTVTPSDGTTYVDGSATTTYPNDNNWHFIAVTGITITASVTVLAARNNFIALLSGCLDEPRIYSGTLTAKQVYALYKNPAGIPSSLALLPRLTSGSILSKQIELGTWVAPTDVNDTFISSGKHDFDNVDNGFILGVDDTDSSKAKFYIGSSTKYWDYDGTDVEFVGGAYKNLYTAGENITSGEVVCIKNSYTDYICSDDSYTDSGNPTTNYGTAQTLFMKSAGDQYDTFIKFDAASLSGLPAVGNIQRAVLRVYHNNYLDGSADIELYQITSADWVEGTITHNNKPTGFTSYKEDTQTFTVGNMSSWIEYDITRLVRGWIEGDTYGLLKYGFKLVPLSSTNRQGIASSENAGYEPHIRVYNNSASDGKAYLAQDANDGSFTYNTVRNVIGIAAETKNATETIKIYDIPGSLITNVSGLTAGSNIYVGSGAGGLTTITDMIHLASIGIARSTTSLLLMPQKPYLIERFPGNTAVNGGLEVGDTNTFLLFAPYDALKVVIYYYATDGASKASGRGSLTVMKTGSTIDEVNYTLGGAGVGGQFKASWVGNVITLTYRTGWLSTPEQLRLNAYFYTK